MEWTTRSIGGAVLIVVAVAGCTAGESTLPAAAPTPTTSVSPTTSTSFDDGTCRFGHVPSTGRVTDRSDETGWVEADPLDHGVDGPQVHKALDELVELPGIFSFLIARHGVLVIERYFNGAARLHSREIASASKSIMSAVVGIAIERENLFGIDDPIETLLPQAFEGGTHADKANIRLRSLLTMSGGFAYEPAIAERQSSIEDVSVESILSTHFTPSPTGFLYNTGGVHLASAIITEASGSDTCHFAQEFLFGPAGITVDWWNHDRDGIFTGGWNLYLTPRELARFGQLYLDDGVRDGRQVIPSEWIQESFTPKSQASGGPGLDYGYWWWVSEVAGYPLYSARGGGEQMIYVIPSLDVVVVTTSETDLRVGANRFNSTGFLQQHVLPAISE